MKTFVALLGLLLSVPGLAKEFTATINWSERVTLSPLVSGAVADVMSKPGALVKKGDLLLRLQPETFQTALKHAQALRDSAQLDKQEGDKELGRAQELYDRTVLSDHELELARAAAARARAKLEAAHAELEQAKLAVQYSELRAPFDGVVVSVSAAPGQVVISELQATPLLVLAKFNPAYAEKRMSLDDLKVVPAVSEVSVRFHGKMYKARAIATDVEPDKDGRYRLRVEFEHEQPLVRQGEQAEIVMP
ncbi:MAG: efflux RND transporter periplasmic adaptor subunit [Gammaproteobacteria bacterium]|nr:efflux RND transporter periplasmic adaptor subunit [Gammaproteobacteria bacterium]